MSDGTEVPVPGVTSMDHTADVALEVRAPGPEELFARAAAGMFHLLLERRPGHADEERSLDLSASEADALFRNWLRELLFWHDSEGFAPASVEVRRIRLGPGPDRAAGASEGDRATGGPGPDAPCVLEAVVRGGIEEAPPVREIKGVTLHGLAVEPRDDGWYGRVIFDV